MYNLQLQLKKSARKYSNINSTFYILHSTFSRGFTLMELLIVMAILGILATLLIGNFMTSQKKSRDSQRKSDLKQIQEALEMYLNDKGTYPSASSGQIVGCGSCGTPEACTWDSQPEFKDTTISPCGTTYMKKLPKDPLAVQNYYYWTSTDQKSYKLYTCLENTRDPRILDPLPTGVSCGGGCATCNYGMASSNAVP